LKLNQNQPSCELIEQQQAATSAVLYCICKFI